jgi:hypothetical protein
VSELLASGRLVDLILGLLVVEAALLWGWRRRSASAVPARGLPATLLSGACLLLALRVALTGGDTRWLLLSLSAALLAHLSDLYLRLRHSGGAS